MAGPLPLQAPSALLIIDMQNGFCHAEGSFGRMGLPVERLFKVVPSINELRNIFHQHSLPVIYTREGWAEDYSDSGILLTGMFAPLKDMKGLVRGTWDFDVIDELAPDKSKGDIVVDKTRNSGFWHTDLAQTLRGLGIKQLVVTGVGTNVCVESTVRDAITEGFPTVTVADATATLSEDEYEASITNLKYFGGTVAKVEVVNALRDN